MTRHRSSGTSRTPPSAEIIEPGAAPVALDPRAGIERRADGSRAGDSIPAGIAYIIAANFIFGLINVAAKWLAESHAVVEVVFFRNAFALVPILWMMQRQGAFAELRRINWAGHTVRGVVGFCHLSLLFLSFTLMPIADATALTFAAPLFLTALSVPFLGERVGVWRWTAVLAGLAGVLIAVPPTGEIGALGLAVGLGSAACFALAMITVRKVSGTDSSITIAFTYTLIMTFLSGIATIFAWSTPSLSELLLLAGLGLIGGFGQFFLARAFERAPASVTAPFTYTAMIWAVLFGWIIWSDVPGLELWIGCAIVVASGLVIIWRESRRRPPVDDAASEGTTA